jgi:hypothetical protein
MKKIISVMIKWENRYGEAFSQKTPEFQEFIKKSSKYKGQRSSQLPSR